MIINQDGTMISNQQENDNKSVIKMQSQKNNLTLMEQPERSERELAYMAFAFGIQKDNLLF